MKGNPKKLDTGMALTAIVGLKESIERERAIKAKTIEINRIKRKIQKLNKKKERIETKIQKYKELLEREEIL